MSTEMSDRTKPPKAGGKGGIHMPVSYTHLASNWILMDYGAVVVHIFQAETRTFYDLERLWKDGRQLEAAAFLPGEKD